MNITFSDRFSAINLIEADRYMDTYAYDANISIKCFSEEIKMANVRVKDQQKASPDSAKAEVGEVDTRAPFQSVKAAVSLFGEVAVSKGKQASPTKKKLSENDELDMETQLLLARKELTKVKQQLESAETTKARALSELDKAKRTLEELNTKIKSVSDSKKSAMKAAEEVKARAKNLEEVKARESIEGAAWKQELDHARNEYISTVTQLDAAKQELTKIRQDFDAALEAKLVAFQQAGEAQRSAKVNSDRVTELRKEIAAMQGSIEQLKVVSIHAQQEQAKVVAEREARLQDYKAAKQQAEDKLLSLKEEVDPELIKDLEAKLGQTTVEVEVLQEEMRKAHASEMDSVRVVTMELNEATKKLQEVAEEESSLRSFVSSLRLELEDVKMETGELRNKEMELEVLATSLTAEMEKNKAEAERLKEEADRAAVQKLSSETESARLEAEKMKQNVVQQKREAEDSRNSAEEAEKKLKLALEEAEDAIEAEKRALEQLKALSGTHHDTAASESTTPSTTGKIKLSLEDYECLSRKAKECESLAEIREAECIVQVEAISVRKNEADKRLEASLKAIEEIKTATNLALRNAESADSAKSVVEGELRKWRQEEQTVVVGESSRPPF
ncbi:putative WEB family protein [Rosa chinensis]|uniref:Putative WEB family protein n=2 Tax=Rosa chinensis TaxID=74649 RepID=A0A2P6Q1Z9_ROSCH|nr:putative WEB family protein [Rosa chinensis]